MRGSLVFSQTQQCLQTVSNAASARRVGLGQAGLGMHHASLEGAREAFGAHTLAMAATFIAFGAAAAAAGFGLGWALASTGGVYGMAGQVVLLSAGQGTGTAAALSAIAANARFLPMAVAIGPFLRGRCAAVALPLIAITTWAAAMQRLPQLPPALRLHWFLGFGLTSWTVALLSTGLGHALAPHLPQPLLAALVFLNPLYFGLLIAIGAVHSGRWRAALGGALAAPLALLVPSPAWGLILAALLGGTAAVVSRRR